jgi:hypothetical protein
MTLKGKGFFIWKIRDCEKGIPTAIAAAALSAGLTHVLVKVADGSGPYNISKDGPTDLVPPVVEALKAAGLQVWGWQYIYGFDPKGEARIAARRVKQFNLDGFVIDAESEFKIPGRAAAARRYSQDLRNAIPNVPLALSSFRFPSYHRAFPWREFLEVCDINMPQVYWEKAHNPGPQLKRCVAELTALQPSRPVIPTAPTYKTGGWRPTPADFTEFFASARELNLAGANFFSWDECTRDLPELWKAMSEYRWEDGSFQPPQQVVPTGPPPPELLAPFFQALNHRSLDELMPLYHHDAIHISDDRMVKGEQALREWYQDLWNRQLPEATFTFHSSSGSPPGLMHFDWRAFSPTAIVENGSDAVGIMEGKIAVHHTQFGITQKA